MATTISNPPYNMKWQHPFFAQSQERFMLGVPPQSNANYAFILTALSKQDKGFLSPNGVLTTNNKEEQAIKKSLIEKNYLRGGNCFTRQDV